MELIGPIYIVLQVWEELQIKMGKLLSKIFGNKEMRILMLGLDAAGKTSILSWLYWLKWHNL